MLQLTEGILITYRLCGKETRLMQRNIQQ